MKYEKVAKTIEVPKGAGVDGFIVALRAILKIPKMQEIKISRDGSVAYSYYKKEGVPESPLKLDFESVTPAAIVRNVPMQELGIAPEDAAPAVVCQMFYSAYLQQLVPTYFVLSTASLFWKWHQKHGVDMGVGCEFAYGLPIVVDTYIPEEAVILCMSYTSGGTLIDTVRTMKAVMLV